MSSLRDPQQDEDRVKKPEWLVMLGRHRARPTASRVRRATPAQAGNGDIMKAPATNRTDKQQVSAHIWVVCQSARLVTTVDGSAPATVPTTISLDVYARDLLLLTSRSPSTISSRTTRWLLVKWAPQERVYEYDKTVGDGRRHSLPIFGGGDVVILIDGNRQTGHGEEEMSGRAFSRLARCNAIVQKHPSSKNPRRTFLC